MMYNVVWIVVISLALGTQGQTPSDVRLVGVNGGTRGAAGRLEVYNTREWITVQGLFERAVADIVCRQLGYPNAHYWGDVDDLGYSRGTSSTAYTLSSCDWSGATSLFQCMNNSPATISHSNDIGVICSGLWNPTGTVRPSLTLREGDLRLNSVGDLEPRTYSGRLEVYYNNQWGTVCDDNFGSVDADVACRQMGYIDSLYFGNVGTIGSPQGSGEIWLDNVSCFSSTQTSLTDCVNSGFGIHNCQHMEDVGLVCLGAGSLRLSSTNQSPGSVGLSTGRLEVYVRDQWGTVCDDMFEQSSADVACRQLGFIRADSFDAVQRSSDYDLSLPILLDDVKCSISDYLLVLCPNRGIGFDNCQHSEDIAITCSTLGVAATVAISVVVPLAIIGLLVFVLLYCRYKIKINNNPRRIASNSSVPVSTTRSTVPTPLHTFQPTQPVSQPAQPSVVFQYPRAPQPTMFDVHPMAPPAPYSSSQVPPSSPNIEKPSLYSDAPPAYAEAISNFPSSPPLSTVTNSELPPPPY